MWKRNSYYYKNRYYSADQGRFISRDPIGYDGGVNIYEYGFSNPVFYSDPQGEIAWIPVGIGLYKLYKMLKKIKPALKVWQGYCDASYAFYKKLCKKPHSCKKGTNNPCTMKAKLAAGKACLAARKAYGNAQCCYGQHLAKYILKKPGKAKSFKGLKKKIQSCLKKHNGAEKQVEAAIKTCESKLAAITP